MSTNAVRVADDLPPYEVLCMETRSTTTGHDHVQAIETADPDGGNTHWALAEVIAAIGAGERFVVFDDGHGRETVLVVTRCEPCATSIVEADKPGVEVPGC